MTQLVRIWLQCRRPGFDPWVGKIPWRRERLPTAVFWPEECHGLCNPSGHKEWNTTEQLSLTVTAAMKLKDACSLERYLWQTDSILKSYSQSCGFSSSHVWVWELDHKEGWAPKCWCFWTVVLEKTLESPLDCRRLNQSILKGIIVFSLEGVFVDAFLEFSCFFYNPIDTDNLIFIGRTMNILWKDWCWSWSSNTFAPMWRVDSLEMALILEKTEGRRKEDDRGWDGWRASQTQWTWVWASSRKW